MRVSGLLLVAVCASVPAQVMTPKNPANAVPSAPSMDARAQSFHDSKYGVRFDVPAGWSFARKDGEVSTFHLDALDAPPKAEMRGAASLGFNPYPQSVLSGATFYYSVERHAKDSDCAAQVETAGFQPDVQDIAGVEFRHGHDEHGGICVEERDDVYTAYRKGSCYRFDLEMNTFCSVSSGAADLTDRQMREVEQSMTNILSTVALDWKKGGAHPVPVPNVSKKPADPQPALLPRPAAPVHQGQ